ncbi:Programmed cell death protein [Nesidiocoris tenuis]|uniref:Programmed cell death protein n=1 Tax=Nesidiocoris tenuis TaxID=355587 RepID=A0ABN7AIQ9_9HEMI|nr:Programmed cell death protein [Nesidiocoris tenuis]
MLNPKNPLVEVSEYEDYLGLKEGPADRNRIEKRVKKKPKNLARKSAVPENRSDDVASEFKSKELRRFPGKKLDGSNFNGRPEKSVSNGSNNEQEERANEILQNELERPSDGRDTPFIKNDRFMKRRQRENSKSPGPLESKFTNVRAPKRRKQRSKRIVARMRSGLQKNSNDAQTESPKNATLVPSCFEDLGAFDWNATAKDLAKVVSNQTQQHSESEESDEEVPTKRKKLSKAEKRLKALEEEKKLKLKERELLEADENPNSPDHFERLLVGCPDSAEIWIKYMGYHAVNADIEKARAVGRRAIKRIDPQQSASKLDVWKALLNLEHSFCPLETFRETFAEALKCNDDYAINTQVLKLYADSKNVTEVDQLTNIMVKKYKDNVECWLQCQNALMSVGLNEKARNLLQKALAVLTKKNHITLISRFALLENKHGFPEQAQALFENLMTSFPQRLDLLSVYVDMLVKSQCIEMARNVLERAAGNTLPARKMKSIYTKWLAFEEMHGSPSDVSKVEKAAKKYVANIMELPDRKNLEEIKEEVQNEEGPENPSDEDGVNADDGNDDSDSQYHDTLVEGIGQLNRFYGPVVMAGMAYSFVGLVAELFFICVTSGGEEPNSILAYFMYLCFSASNALYLFAITQSCHNAVEKMFHLAVLQVVVPFLSVADFIDQYFEHLRQSLLLDDERKKLTILDLLNIQDDLISLVDRLCRAYGFQILCVVLFSFAIVPGLVFFVVDNVGTGRMSTFDLVYYAATSSHQILLVASITALCSSTIDKVKMPS